MNLPTKFKHYLITQGVSPNTVRNYLADFNHFAAWIEQEYQLRDEAIFTKLDSTVVSRYQAHLTNLSLSLATINRRLSTLNKLYDFGQNKGLATPAKLDFHSTKNKQSNHELISEFDEHLKKQRVSPNTRKNYLSDIRHFLNWIGTN